MAAIIIVEVKSWTISYRADIKTIILYSINKKKRFLSNNQTYLLVREMARSIYLFPQQINPVLFSNFPTNPSRNHLKNHMNLHKKASAHPNHTIPTNNPHPHPDKTLSSPSKKKSLSTCNTNKTSTSTNNYSPLL